MGDEMIFYGYFRSSAAYRCRIAFHLKGLSPQTVFINLREGAQKAADFLALNPHGMVPAVASDGHFLTQSLAIIEWLEETHPAPALLPRDPFARAYVRSLALSIACDIHPLQNLRVLKHVRDSYGLDQTGVDQWCRRWIESGLASLEEMVNRTGTAGRFLYGDEPGLADICLVPQMFSAVRFGADTSRLTTLNRIAAHCGTLPAFADAHPARQADAAM